MCQRVQLPDGTAAIVCGGHSRKRCSCGRRETRLCDWKVPTRKSGTCDRSLCDRCATSPAPDKDLCGEHAVAFAAWQAEQATRTGAAA